MKTKSRSKRKAAVARKSRLTVVASSSVVNTSARQVVPLKDRQLKFGDRWDYAPAPETFDYIKIPQRHELFINGKFVAPHSDKYFDSLNPATEEKLSDIAAADAEDGHKASQAARRAY